jgi:hypothetical protein
MNPSTGSNIAKFSPCTIGNICSAMLRNSVKTSCLVSNKGISTITRSQCGNGIVEAGEDCDCGGESGCAGNTCCDPTTCKFSTANNAVCDPSNEDCCSSNCQFAGAGTVCRASTGTCDPQETCSGTNATCPPDVNAPDGKLFKPFMTNNILTKFQDLLVVTQAAYNVLPVNAPPVISSARP